MKINLVIWFFAGSLLIGAIGTVYLEANNWLVGSSFASRFPINYVHFSATVFGILFGNAHSHSPFGARIGSTAAIATIAWFGVFLVAFLRRMLTRHQGKGVKGKGVRR